MLLFKSTPFLAFSLPHRLSGQDGVVSAIECGTLPISSVSPTQAPALHLLTVLPIPPRGPSTSPAQGHDGIRCPLSCLGTGTQEDTSCRVSVVREEAFTIIFLSKEAPDLLSSLLRGIFIIWKVLHVLRTDHFENRLQQIESNNTCGEQ